MVQSTMIEIAKQKGALLTPTAFQAALIAEFGDVDQLCQEVRYWDLQFQPLTVMPEKRRVAYLVQGTCGHFELSYARFRQNLDQRGAPPAGKLTFTIPGPTLRSLWWCGKETASNDVLVYYPGNEWRSISDKDFEVYLISIPLADFASYSARCGMPDADPRLLQTVFMAPQSLLAQAQTVLFPLLMPAPYFDTLKLDGLVEDLIGCWLAQTGLKPRKAEPHKSKLAISKILEKIDAGETHHLNIPELCAGMGLSRRALEIAFKEKFGVGPAAFVKSWKMAQSRRLLMQADPQKISVADVMAEHGFVHVGQFATDYKRWFQELPSETLSRSPIGSL